MSSVVVQMPCKAVAIRPLEIPYYSFYIGVALNVESDDSVNHRTGFIRHPPIFNQPIRQNLSKSYVLYLLCLVLVTNVGVFRI